MEQYPRLLIISHNLFDNTNNIGKTLVSLLDGWPIDKLAQINFRNEVPSYTKCKKYYSITDKDVALSVITFGIHKAGRALDEFNHNNVSSNTEKVLYRFGNKRIPFVSFIRDIMWGFGGWKNNQLKNWVRQFAPEVILFVPNDYVLAYKVALFIEDQVKIPLIPYYMDDVFYYDCDTRGIDYLRRLQLRKQAKQIHSYASRVFTICKKMSLKYEKQFAIPCTDYMNSIKTASLPAKIENKEIMIFTYIGNLHSNRWICLVDIGKALQNVSKNTNIAFELHIYSASDLGKKEMNVLASVPIIHFKGGILPSEVQKKQRDADVLVHVEAFDRHSKNSTMYSISTKIPEYLNSGVSIFAYGPSDIASIEYLKDNKVAYICDKKEELEHVITSMITNQVQRRECIQRGVKLAREKHNLKNVCRRFINDIIDCSKISVGLE